MFSPARPTGPGMASGLEATASHRAGGGEFAGGLSQGSGCKRPLSEAFECMRFGVKHTWILSPAPPLRSPVA